MIGKFATATALALMFMTVLWGAQGFAQTTPAGQTPAAPAADQTPSAETPPPQAPATQAPVAQQPSNGQEPADEVSSSRRKRAHDYKNWNYNVGLGANLDSGTTREFVRGGGGVASAGVARNANKYLGLRADFIFADLPLRDSSLQLAQAGSATR